MRYRSKKDGLKLVLDHSLFSLSDHRKVLNNNEQLVAIPDLIALNVHNFIERIR